MRFLFVLSVILFLPFSAFAQEQEPVESEPITKQNYGKFLIDDGLWATTLVFGATVYDIETTYAALGRCKTCYESNPAMRPFVDSGRPAAYAVNIVANFGILYLAHWLKYNDDEMARELWWIIPVSAVVSHSIAGSFNLRFVF